MLFGSSYRRFQPITACLLLLFLAASIVAISPQVRANSSQPDYALLQKKIIRGHAKLAEVRQALTQKDVAAMTNTMHALFVMRWHRGVYKLLFNIWDMRKELYPELAWDILEKVPVKIALASTINRIQIVNTDKYKDYIRAHKYDSHEFHRAQATIALGFNGAPQDIDYLQEMANEDNPYVAQSAITALALMGGYQARDAMIELLEIHHGKARGNLIKELLQQVYEWSPSG